MVSDSARTVYMALDLSNGRWDLAVWTGGNANPSLWQLKGESYDHASKLEGLEQRLRALADQYGPELTIHCCYEASWLGVWLDRWLHARGVNNLVISPSSVEVAPTKKRKKTDRIDACKLVRKLKQYLDGDRRAFRPVRVPRLQEQAVRQRQRERQQLKTMVQQHRSRLESKLSYYGIGVKSKPVTAADWKRLIAKLPVMKTYAGEAIAPTVIEAMARAAERLAQVERQRAKVEGQIAAYHRGLPADSAAKKLERLRGVGVTTSQQLCAEIMDWGRFRNRKQPGSFAGLCPTPWSSGPMCREQGIGKDGNGRIRATMVETAWLWVRWQPSSELTLKWACELAKKGRRRRMAIVALARQLLVSLWRYITQDVPIPGAVLSG